MNRLASPEQSAETQAEFDALGVELVDLQTQIAALHGALAAGYDAKLDGELDALRARRTARLLEWAEMALRWQLDGGVVALTDVDEDDDDDETLHAYDDDPGSILDSVVLGPAFTGNAGSGSVESGSLRQVERAQGVVRRLSPPKPAPTAERWFDEANQLHQELLSIGGWGDFPRGLQHTLTAHFAARLRRLQDDAPAQVKVVVQLQLKKDFARLGQFSAEFQPGWVAGLGRHNPPEHGNWTEDADVAWQKLCRDLGALTMDAEMASLNPEVALRELDELLATGADSTRIRRAAIRALNAGVASDDPRLARLLVPHLEALAGDKGLKRLRKAVRAAATVDTPVPDSEPPGVVLPEDWPFWSVTRGKVGVIVGGDPREAARERIHQAFDFNTLAWESADIRGVQRLAERVHGGGIDVVLLLARFISHKATDVLVPALREANIPWAMVRRGYGVVAIQQALERYLAERGEG